MPTQIERLAMLETTQKRHETDIARLMPMEARMEAVETKVDSFAPVLAGINGNLEILVNDKTRRDVQAETKDKAKTPWQKFVDKLIDSAATIVSGGVIGVLVWVFLGFIRSNG